MITLQHYDDGKQKYQSHEIYIVEEDFYNLKHDISSHNPFDITGYGETKEEALEQFIDKFDYVMNELLAFQTLLHENCLEINERYEETK